MLRTLLFFAAFTCASGFALAQPQLTTNDLFTIGEHSMYAADLGTFTEGAAGANQSWAFADLAFGSYLPQWYVATAGSPFDTAFGTISSVALKTDQGGFIGEHFTYYSISSSKAEFVGTGAANNTTPTIHYTDPEQVMQFPFAFGNSFTDSYEYTTVVTSSSYLHVVGTVTVSYDAYGTLMLGSATYENAVRVKTERNLLSDQYLADTLWMSTPYSETLYSWYIPGNPFPVFQLAENVYRYLEGPGHTSPSAVGAAPTPMVLNASVQQGTLLITSNGSMAASLAIYSLDGRLMHRERAVIRPDAAVHVNAAAWPAGAYMVAVDHRDGRHTQKIVIP